MAFVAHFAYMVKRYWCHIAAVSLLVILYVAVTKEHPKEPLDCLRLIEGAREEVLKRRFEVNHSYSGELVIPSCSFLDSRLYMRRTISAVERENPIAYIFVVYKNSKQFERLFHSVYRSTNAHCIHVDTKANREFLDSIKNISNCLPNVILINKYDVRWGTISTVLPEIDCMRHLLESTVDWKYVINLTGEEFPLKTNRQIAKITKSLNGANWIVFESDFPTLRYYKKMFSPVPYGLTLYKGPLHAIMVRGFAEFVVFNETAKVLLDYLSDTWIPDETFYATLNFNSRILHVPGAFTSCRPLIDSDLSVYKEGHRYKKWKPDTCFGFYSRNICILSAGDIPLMVASRSLFANKFYAYYEPAGLDCLEWWLERNSPGDLADGQDDYYRELDFVANHL